MPTLSAPRSPCGTDTREHISKWKPPEWRQLRAFMTQYNQGKGRRGPEK